MRAHNTSIIIVVKSVESKSSPQSSSNKKTSRQFNHSVNQQAAHAPTSGRLAGASLALAVRL